MLYRLGLVLFFSGSSLAALAETAPAVIPNENKAVTAPLWVAAAAAADSRTVLNWSLLGLSAASPLHDEVQEQRKALGEEAKGAGSGTEVRWIQDRECRTRLEVIDHRGGSEPSSSLQDLLAYSKNIFWGTLRSLTPGFTSGAPATLLGIEVEEVLRGTDAAPKQTVFLSRPTAAFSVGAFQFCASGGWRPSVGDRVLVFDYTGPRGAETSLYLPREDQVIFASREGGLVLPPRLKADQSGPSRLSDTIAGTIGLRSYFGRKGLLLLAGLQIDPGFEGHLVIGGYNAAPRRLTLDYEVPFVTIEFRRLAHPVERPYVASGEQLKGRVAAGGQRLFKNPGMPFLVETSRLSCEH